MLLNDGSGNLTLLHEEALPSFTASAGDPEVFDSDNDGDLDILMCGSPVVLLENTTNDEGKTQPLHSSGSLQAPASSR